MSDAPFDLHARLAALAEAGGALQGMVARLSSEVQFATGLAKQTPGKTEGWLALIDQAVDHLRSVLTSGEEINIPHAVREAEALMAPIGEVARQYTIHCCGHAHIDMNWMWSWPETVSATQDTFATVDRLMSEYPDFHFSQSQVSVYKAMQQYCPEAFERIRARVAEGRWEITASQWVEGDKNLASGEILARHLLYSRRWLRDNLGVPFDAVKIDWECDTFGHAFTLPGILNRGGVTRYYHHRAGVGKRLYWWEGKDGSRVLAYDDAPVGYNCDIAPYMADLLLAFARETGLNDMMWIYGVGDHGGGPTRKMLDTARDMADWPIWPNVKLSTTDAFFSIAEREARDLPVVKQELNFVFRGCYTAESWVKHANRLSENSIVDAEACAVLAGGLVGFTYPRDGFVASWERAMFIQFHDILPGSGVRETRDYCQGLLQETLAQTQTTRTRALRALAARVNTGALAGTGPGPGLGAGVGRGAWWGGLSSYGAGASEPEPFVVFNPLPYPRSDVVTATLWDREIRDGYVTVRDSDGSTTGGQVIQRGHYWGHTFVEVSFPATVPGLGYETYAIGHAPEPTSATGVSVTTGQGAAYGSDIMGGATIENEFLRVSVEPGSGAIASLLDKRTGKELVPRGKRLGLLIHQMEAPHGMTSWEIGQVVEETPLVDGASVRVMVRGPHVGAVETSRTYRGCPLQLVIALKTGSPIVYFRLHYDWRDFGGPAVGVPVLKVSFPVEVRDGHARFEIPCGYIDRPANGDEVPALRWADLGGPDGGVALLNKSKYGYTVTADEMRLTILRASYDPDPLPEVGDATVDFALLVHNGIAPAAITREAQALNHELAIVGTDAHGGDLPLSAGYCDVRSPNVVVSGLKRAEDSDRLVLRIYETEGAGGEVRIRLAPGLASSGSNVVEADLLEQPLAASTARWDGEELVVAMPAHGIVTLLVG